MEELTPLTEVQTNARITYYQSLFAIVIGITTFGASITFSLIVTETRQPNFHFSSSSVQLFVAISWLCFVMALGAACILASFLNFYGALIKEDWNSAEGQKKWLWFGGGATVILGGLLFVAFFFLSLSVMAYVKVVGIIAVVFTVLIGFFAAIVGWMTRRVEAGMKRLLRGRGWFGTSNV
jgi:hypothetical protein